MNEELQKQKKKVTPYDVFKPKKDSYTAIIAFEVINPQGSYESKGEVLYLSRFGEYCPNQSLRGYQLIELLMKPDNYRPVTIVQKGELMHLPTFKNDHPRTT